MFEHDGSVEMVYPNAIVLDRVVSAIFGASVLFLYGIVYKKNEVVFSGELHKA